MASRGPIPGLAPFGCLWRANNARVRRRRWPCDGVAPGRTAEPLAWRVIARARYGKAELPISDIFVREGPPRLAVITCGRDFDPVTRSYSDNVVVYAEPA